MKITIESLKKTIASKKYKWFDDINIIGIRTTLQVPDAFNDFLCVIWKQKSIPNSLNFSQKQQWLKDNLFLGKNGKPLVIDGDFGANSEFAFNTYKSVEGKERLNIYTITTDPGTYWLQNPLSKLGTAVLKPGQYENCWKLGFHKTPSHKALVQIGNVTVYRDNDKDVTAETSSTEETGLFGINIHGSGKKSILIGKWSAGCQVFNEWSKKEEFISICEEFKTERGNKFSYTLLNEIDLIG